MATRRPSTSSACITLALAALLFAGAPALSWAEERTVGVSAGPETEGQETPAAQAAAEKTEASSAVVALDDATEEAFDVTAHPSAEKKKSGLPQLDPSSYPSQIFWLLTCFALLYTLMSRVALPRVTEVLDMRQTQRDNNLNRAEHLQEDIEKIRTTVDAAMAAAHADAQTAMAARELETAKKITAENARFADHARTRIANAEQNIAKAKEDALQSLTDIAAEVAADIVNKLTAAAVNKADAKKVVSTLVQEKQ